MTQLDSAAGDNGGMRDDANRNEQAPGRTVLDPSSGGGGSERLVSRGDQGVRGDQGGVSDSLTEAIIGSCIEADPRSAGGNVPATVGFEGGAACELQRHGAAQRPPPI